VTFGDDLNTWAAHSDNTTTLDDTTNLLGLSDTGSMACPVVFTPNQASNNTNVSTPQTNVWTLYGKYVVCNQDKVNFYAQRTDQDGWYVLLWSAMVDAALQNIPVTLRTIGPALG
jgi:hypothetical protein